MRVGGLIITFLFIFTFHVVTDAGAKNVYPGVKVSFKLTRPQLKFVNKHFDCVITRFLSRKVRNNVKGPILLLYRSIRGTWEGFSQFDWDYINSHENMFCHRDGRRIKTIYNSWLMNGADLVDATSPDALTHWVNYYAVTAAQQVYEYGDEGLFIDSAGHKLWRGAVYGKMPDGYTDAAWRDARYKALKFIKKYLPDKIVIFNGLHSDNGAERSLYFTDGGMWETFAFNPSTGKYFGKTKWEEVIELVRRNCDEKFIAIVSKKRGFTADAQLRMFVLGSYLLVANKNVFLYISDLDYGIRCILYYPEYDVDLGAPSGSYFKREGVYQRNFDKGIVLVNPDPYRAYTVSLDGEYTRVVPEGGGVVRKDGQWYGDIEYKTVSGRVTLFPLSGVILKR